MVKKQVRHDAGKQAWFNVAMVVLTLVVIEAGAFAFLSLTVADGLKIQSLQSERREIIDGVRPRYAGGGNLPTSMAVMEPHPYVGYVIKKSLSMDKFGFANSVPPIQKREEGKVLIGLMGGSVAGLVKQDFRKVLELSGLFEGRQIVLLGFGIAGHKQPQQLTLLAYLLSLGAEFDYLINLDGFNEATLVLAHHVRTRTSASFPRHWRFYVRSYFRQLSPGALIVFQGIEYFQMSMARVFSFWPLSKSYAANSVWRALDHGALKVRDKLLERGMRRMKARQFIGPDTDYDDRESLYIELAEVWKRSSIAMQALAEAHDISYFHFLQPNQYVTGSKPLSDEERLLAVDKVHVYQKGVGVGYPLMIEAARELKAAGVAFGDLTRIFSDHPETLYVDDCCHYNKKGNWILSEAMVGFIRGALKEENVQAA